MSTTAPTRRRRQRGAAWHWRQTDAWYYTPPGTKRRVRLLDEEGRPVRGKENRQAAELALARIKAAGDWPPAAEPGQNEPGQSEPWQNEPGRSEPWLVAQVCSQFIQHCGQRAAAGAIGQEYCDEVVRHLNDLCGYCGALPVSQLRKGHVEHWVESHSTWRSPVTRRGAITNVLAAFIACSGATGTLEPVARSKCWRNSWATRRKWLLTIMGGSGDSTIKSRSGRRSAWAGHRC